MSRRRVSRWRLLVLGVRSVVRGQQIIPIDMNAARIDYMGLAEAVKNAMRQHGRQ